MKKIVFSLFAILSIALSCSAQFEARNANSYFANNMTGEMQVIGVSNFEFDSAMNKAVICLNVDSVNADTLPGNICFYSADGQLIKCCEQTFIGNSEDKSFTETGCHCVLPFILHGNGYVKIEIKIDNVVSLVCIILCDNFKYA